MTKLKELKLIQESIEKQIESLREEADKNRPEKDGYLVSIHTSLEGMYEASVWKHSADNMLGTIDTARVTFNDIVLGSNKTMELDEYCQTVQIYLCKINEIEGY